MACELPMEKEMSLSEFIKILYEFEDLDTLYECVKSIKEKYTLDEVNELSDEDMYNYFIKFQKN